MPISISEDVFRTVLPDCREPGIWAPAVESAAARNDITTIARLSCFLAQTAYESSQFNKLVENLVYKSASRLVAVWPKRFPTLASAAPYVNNDKALANYVYANRLGNGDVASGDGYRYRGRGLIQLTGRSNYREAGKALSIDLESQPEQLEEPETAALSAGWFWSSRGLNALADDKTDDNDLEDFREITKRINGGTTGISDRLALCTRIEQALSAASLRRSA